jgi:predicted hydrolase (HD superfamily)
MTTRALAGLSADALEQQLRGDRAERLGGLIHHRQEGRQHREVLDVVEAHQRHVGGNREALLAKRLHGAPSAVMLLTVKTALGHGSSRRTCCMAR